MAKSVFLVALVLALQACSGIPSNDGASSACASSPASYACQIEAYQRAP